MKNSLIIEVAMVERDYGNKSEHNIDEIDFHHDTI